MDKIIFAQGSEFGVVTTFMSWLGRTLDSIEIWFQTTGPERWIWIVALALGVVWFLSRRGK